MFCGLLAYALSVRISLVHDVKCHLTGPAISLGLSADLLGVPILVTRSGDALGMRTIVHHLSEPLFVWLMSLVFLLRAHTQFQRSRKSSFIVVNTRCVFVRSMNGMANMPLVNLLNSSLVRNFAMTRASVSPVIS